MSTEITGPFQASDLSLSLMSTKNKKGTKVTNPATGGLSFGRVPKNKNGIPEGEIFLKVGYVGFGPRRKGAYGARHVWEKHREELGITSPEDVPEKLSKILKPGSKVLVDSTKGDKKIVALNTTEGLVALQEEEDGYSIITAYGRKDPTGIEIGELEGPEGV